MALVSLRGPPVKCGDKSTWGRTQGPQRPVCDDRQLSQPAHDPRKSQDNKQETWLLFNCRRSQLDDVSRPKLMHANSPLFSKSLLIQGGGGQESGALTPPAPGSGGFEQEKPPLPRALDAPGPLRSAPPPPEGPGAEGQPT